MTVVNGVPTSTAHGPESSPTRQGDRRGAAAGLLAVRLLARLVDFVIANALLLGAAVATGTFGESSGSSWPGAPIVFAGLVAGEATLVRYWARTPGKAAFGLVVTAPAGGRLSWWRAAGRALLAWSPLYPVFLTVASPAEQAGALLLLAIVAGPALVRQDHRGLHDLLAGAIVTRPARAAHHRLRRLGVDLAVLGGAVFTGAFVAYGFGSDPGFWAVDTVPYGVAAQLAFPPHASDGYIFAPTGLAAPDCTVTAAGGRTVPLGTAHPPAPDEHVRALGMRAVYAFTLGDPQPYTVVCGTPGQPGRYAVGSHIRPSRTAGNILEGAGLGAFVLGMVLLVRARRSH